METEILIAHRLQHKFQVSWQDDNGDGVLVPCFARYQFREHAERHADKLRSMGLDPKLYRMELAQ